MFERRLKILLVLIFLVGVLLIGRLFAVQVMGHDYWASKATGQLTRPEITETFRGRILDVHGKPLAVDAACTDACVDYQAILDKPDDKWVLEKARERLKARMGPDYAAQRDHRKQMLEEEVAHTKSDIQMMWRTLAQLNPELTPETRPNADAIMDDIRHRIVQSVQIRREVLTRHNQQRDEQQSKASWFRFLAGSVDQTDTLGTLIDETEPHVVLPDLDAETINFLGKRREQFPGLSLLASTHRQYPMKTVACHLLGRMSPVSDADLAQAKRDKLDELRQYLPNDLIGREGIESLCEPVLRGSRGRTERRVGDNAIVFSQDFEPGRDVRLTIDADLQAKAQQMLQHVVEHVTDFSTHQQLLVTPEGGVSMHAAIVVLDVKTNEVRVMASNPGFDANEFQTHYATLAADTLNQPLINRATCDACEPGSSVKPLVGLAAITSGLLGPTDTINCGGYVYLPVIDVHGVTHMERIEHTARCWILSENKPALAEMKAAKNDIVPPNAQHGPLDFAQALERSCDAFFETAADRLSPTGVDHWFDQFGLGRITGIGINERPGLRPLLYHGKDLLDRGQYCLAGMGQGKVLATPLQIANEAATIARDGIWMRPRILTDETQAALDAMHPRPDAVEAVDLHINPEALRQAKLGMINVVDAPQGTGKIKHDGYTLAAKTGTADTASLWVKVKDASGHLVNQRLTPVYRHTDGNPDEGPTPWYRSEDTSGYGVVHAWYMGFAPAEHPQLAFCVLVEYAGAGGSSAAGPIAGEMMQACLQAGYLRPEGGR